MSHRRAIPLNLVCSAHCSTHAFYSSSLSDSDDTSSVTETLPEAALLAALQQQGFLDASSSRHSTGMCTQDKDYTQLCVANFVFGLQRPTTP